MPDPSLRLSQKLQRVSAAFRQAANEATTADAAVTYRDCADAVDAVIARVLVAVCEGCGTRVNMPTLRTRQRWADLPAGWSQCGVSKWGNRTHRRLAAWCPTCREERTHG